MLRCVACNAQLTKFEFLMRKSPDSDEPEDMCPRCKNIVRNADKLQVHEHAFEHLTENWIDFTKYRE